ncbi:tryptophan--tRNA ligase [Vaccinium witches'-broom phytoplasma]|uniref:tryptophan--tRNA ligase n=1 Tax=Vaccinium witches'-broom phytoplasma TaxID=85642 RepID=UPI0003751BE0|nr:tryptophan--tRNA ligase [Vaccinium witches'-broom phytoplasma]
MSIAKKRLVTGIKPTGDLTLGNYLGVVKPLVNFQKKFNQEYDLYVFIADLHALTKFQEPTLLKKRIKNIAALYLASGLESSQVNLFVQSEVVQHTYLSYIMESTSYLGELNRMIQFKEQKKNNSSQNIRTSYYTYPLLMASDILLYDANVVPVGQDQKQHLELTRDLADRFNSLYGETFVIPEFLKMGHTIKSLTEPTKKMSKSFQLDPQNDKGCIFLSEDLKIIRQKIMRSVTDSDKKIYYDVEKKPGISNLLTIYSALKDLSMEETEKYFLNSSYQILKEKVSDVVAETIDEIQKKFAFYNKNSILYEIFEKGAKKSSFIAETKIKKVKKKLGIGWQ